MSEAMLRGIVSKLRRMLDKRERRIEALESLVRNQYGNMDEFGQSCADDLIGAAWKSSYGS